MDASQGNDPVNLILLWKGEELFTHRGKWLHPLFALESFLQGRGIPPAELFLKDKLIGRGAGVLILRMGLSRCHGRVVSQGGLALLEEGGVVCTYDELVPALSCQTETALEGMPLEEAYQELRCRGGYC